MNAPQNMRMKITKKCIVVEKEEIIMKKDMDNKEIMRERKNMTITVHSLKVFYEKAIEVNNELKLNVDEQEDDIKHLNKQCDVDDEHETQEITAAISLMKRKACMCDM